MKGQGGEEKEKGKERVKSKIRSGDTEKRKGDEMEQGK